MADPLSITAGIIAILGAAKNLRDCISSIAKAPKELSGLLEDVSQLEMVFLDIGGGRNIPEESMPVMSWLLDRAMLKLRELTDLSRSSVRAESLDIILADRIRFIKEKKKIAALKQELYNIRRNFMVLLVSRSASGMELLINRISNLERNQEEHRETLGHLLVEFSTSINQMQEKITAMAEKDERQITDRPASVDQRTSFLEPCNRTLPRISSETPLYSFQISQPAEPSCPVGCSCLCHTQRRIQSPQVFHQVFGSLLIAYTGLPLISYRGNETLCRRQPTAAANFSYCFPEWLLMRVVSFVVSRNIIGGLKRCLEVRRTVSIHADILRLASIGEVRTIKSLFEKHLASPIDVCCSDGRSVLHTAVNNLQVETCDFLIRAGADPSLEDQNGVSAADVACSKVFGKNGDRKALEALRRLFVVERCLEKLQLTHIQKIVMGFTDLDLGKLLSLLTSAINNRDAYGRTALLWATQRGDDTSIKILLQYGADPNICDIDGISPFHYACYCTNTATIMHLIEKGAQVNKKDKWRRTRLGNTCSFRDDITYLKPLVAAGADIDAIDYWCQSALSNAVTRDHRDAAAFLIDHGALVDMKSVDGDTPIYEAGSTIRHMVACYADLQLLRILMSAKLKNVDIDSRDEDGYTAMELSQQREDAPAGFLQGFQTLVASIRNAAVEVEDPEDELIEIFEDAVESQAHE